MAVKEKEEEDRLQELGDQVKPCQEEVAQLETEKNRLKEETGWLGFILATIVTIAVAAIFLKLVGLVVLVSVLIITIVLAAYFKKTFGGLTGDNYGAINEVSEVSVLILVNMFVHLGLL